MQFYAGAKACRPVSELMGRGLSEREGAERCCDRKVYASLYPQEGRVKMLTGGVTWCGVALFWRRSSIFEE